jgi:hypothetical protein
MNAKLLVALVLLAVFFALKSSALTLAVALDNTNLTWSTSSAGSGASAWVGQSTTSHFGGSAAQGSLAFASLSSSSTLQTTVTGLGTLTFWWKLSSGASALFGGQLTFKSGSTQLATLTDSADWQQKTICSGSGTQTLQWVTTFYTTAGASTPVNGWVDQVTWTTGATAPVITTQPVGQSGVLGLDVTYRVSAGGTPPLAYQWRFNDTNLLGATNTSYAVTNILAANAGNYDIVITNSTGSVTSSIAPLALGQIASWGDASLDQRYVPADITNALQVAAGLSSSFALKTDHTVAAWGYNGNFQTSLPPGLTNVISIAANNTRCLALKADGTVVSWGTNIVNEPLAAPSNLTNVVAIAVGGNHSLVLKSDGTVTAWGLNTYGQTNVPTGLTNIVSIGAGSGHSIALRSDGPLIAWGSNIFQETNVPGNLTNVMAIATGGSFSAALKVNGAIVSWGNNSPIKFTNTPPGLSNVIAISASERITVALKANGTAVAWGDNRYGQTNVPTSLTNAYAVAAGAVHGFALVGSTPPTSQAAVQNAGFATNGFSFTLPTECGRVYRLEYQTNLGDLNWNASPLVAGNGTNITFTDTNSAADQRFYRVRRW